MNPLVAALLPHLINAAETLVQSEGPVVISWFETEIARLKTKYQSPAAIVHAPADTVVSDPAVVPDSNL